MFAAAAGGVFIGLLPTMVEFVQAPEAFMLHNVYFHSEFTNNMLGLTLAGSLKDIYQAFLEFGYYYASAIFLTVYGLTRLDGPHRYYGLLWLGVLATALAMAAAPLIVYPQYLAPASFFCALASAYVFTHGTRRFRAIVAWGVVPVLLLALADNTHAFVKNVADQGGRPALVRVLAMNRDLKQYSARVDRREPECSDTIFTLSGAFVVDSGFVPSKYMEGGVFWSGINGFRTGEIRRRRELQLRSVPCRSGPVGPA